MKYELFYTFNQSQILTMLQKYYKGSKFFLNYISDKLKHMFFGGLHYVTQRQDAFHSWEKVRGSEAWGCFDCSSPIKFIVTHTHTHTKV
jgi:hypothetical protein